MASPSVFTHDRSGLDPFLYADINAKSGDFLTVASMFGRRGLDPWAEAMRLAALPVAVAVENLAAIIIAMPSRASSTQDATALATNLVALLPGAGITSGAPRVASATHLPAFLMWLMLGLAIAAALTTIWPEAFHG
jgi:hypothetical protein